MFTYRWRQEDLIAIIIENDVWHFFRSIKCFRFAVEIIFVEFDLNRIIVFIEIIFRWHKLFDCTAAAVIDHNAEIISFEHSFRFEFFS